MKTFVTVGNFEKSVSIAAIDSTSTRDVSGVTEPRGQRCRGGAGRGEVRHEEGTPPSPRAVLFD